MCRSGAVKTTLALPSGVMRYSRPSLPVPAYRASPWRLSTQTRSFVSRHSSLDFPSGAIR